MVDVSEEEEYAPSVLRLMNVFNRLGGVTQVTPTAGRTVIDFSMGDVSGLTLLQRAAGGEFGSSVVVDTDTDEIITGTIRLGSLDLPDEADEFVATSRLIETVEETDPPMEFDARLRQMGGDIAHVIVDERVPVADFTPWFKRVVPAVKRSRDDIREFATDIGRSTR